MEMKEMGEVEQTLHDADRNEGREQRDCNYSNTLKIGRKR
jgi:hypothetical protein